MMSQVSRMEQVVQAYVADKQFMGSILVTQNGQTVLDKGYGCANLEWQIPNSPRQNSAWAQSQNSLLLLRFCYLKNKVRLKLPIR